MLPHSCCRPESRRHGCPMITINLLPFPSDSSRFVKRTGYLLSDIVRPAQPLLYTPLPESKALPLEWLLAPKGNPSTTDRILAQLALAEAKEPCPWFRDDIRIAWITVLMASRGNTMPHVVATYQVLGLHPDKVWPAILARRAAVLGRDAELSPRKPVQSVRPTERRKVA
jgi:hypothetical protein